MKHAALSDIIIRKAKPREKRYPLTDGRGLLLEVMPTGSKYWRLIYRVEGRRKTVTLGEYPGVGIVAARQKADELRQCLARGVLPSDVLNPPHLPTFREVAEEWAGKQEGRISQGYLDTMTGRLKMYLFPALGDRPIEGISVTELLGVLRPIEECGHVETAHRVKAVFSSVARYAVACGYCEVDVSAGLRGALRTSKAKPMAALTKPEDIKRLLLAMDAYHGSPVVKCALWFSIYTLARPGEVRHAEWEELDLDAAVWTIPAEKMKMRRPHVVPLCRQAVEWLRWLYPLTGRGQWVFPSPRQDGRPMSENAVRTALRTLGFSNEDMTPHGFRALGSSMLNEMGFRPDVIEAALAHIQPGVRGIYNRTDYLDERRKMMQNWADWLEVLKA